MRLTASQMDISVRTDTKPIVDANALNAISLKKVYTPVQRVLPSAEESAIAEKLAEEDREPIWIQS
jgi:hypothetical protein